MKCYSKKTLYGHKDTKNNSAILVIIRFDNRVTVVLFKNKIVFNIVIISIFKFKIDYSNNAYLLKDAHAFLK